MKLSHRLAFLGLAALLMTSVISDAQSRKGKRATAPATKQVTVTLVRWPYT
jgi:hypothetical protein